MTGLRLVQANESDTNELYIDSLEVAGMIGKRHDHLIRDIDNYVSVLSQNPKLGLIISS
ncbi:Rha family transcriptional regulator [Bacillus cereus]|uniref:Rha family transcriptional regulator n=1 Tax=Bacillus cereus TaxID=1396 RepID=UPI0028531AA6|nr:Rha family transcriptional regulator [Bacillus cereus]MDR4984629.1 Rha family transcriptional regulator [Bacillus cereus]